MKLPVGEFQINLPEAVVQQGDRLDYNGRSYGSTMAADRVEFAGSLSLPGIGRPALSYSFEALEVGGMLLARGGSQAPRLHAEDRRISYERGGVEERYLLRAESLEQTFVVPELPAGRGEIRVTGRVETNLTPPPDGTRGDSLSFTLEGRPLVTVSKAIAKDAAGKTLPLDLAYAGGQVSMTVPASWVETARLPIEIDPIVGSPVTVDGNVAQGAGLIERGIGVAYNSVRNEWYVVWTEPLGASSFNYDVWGQRVSAAGALVGSALAIHWTTGGEYEMAVSHAPSVDRYIVCCRLDGTDNGNPSDAWIHGALVKGDNTGLQGSTFYVSTFTGASKPSAAFDGTRWLVAFEYGFGEVDLRFFTTASPPVASAETAIDWDQARDCYAAYDSTSARYGLVWRNTATGQVVGAVLDAAGNITQNVTVIESPGSPTFPSIAAGSGNFLVSWTQATSFGAYARVLNTSLGPLTAKLTLATGGSEAKYARGRYSPTTGRWLVVYTDPLGLTDLHSNQVTPTGTVQAVEAITATSGVLETIPELAWNSTSDEMLIAYRSGTTAPYSIRACRWSLPAPPSSTVTVTATDATATEEGTNTGTFTFTRTGATTSALEVYFTAGGTASAGDYAALASPVTIPVGSASATRVVTPVNDSEVEIAETVVVTLTPRPEYAIGGTGFATVTITDTDPPLPPTGVRTTAYYNTIDVEWDPSPSPFVAGYNVYRKTGAGGTWSKLNASGLVLITKYRDATAVNGTALYYRVTAVRQ